MINYNKYHIYRYLRIIGDPDEICQNAISDESKKTKVKNKSEFRYSL
jgi:hypothetical protein